MEAQILVATRVDVLKNVLRSPAVVVVKGNYSPADPLAVLAVSIHRPTCRARHCQRGTALQGILALHKGSAVNVFWGGRDFGCRDFNFG